MECWIMFVNLSAEIWKIHHRTAEWVWTAMETHSAGVRNYMCSACNIHVWRIYILYLLLRLIKLFVNRPTTCRRFHLPLVTVSPSQGTIIPWQETVRLTRRLVGFDRIRQRRTAMTLMTRHVSPHCFHCHWAMCRRVRGPLYFLPSLSYGCDEV